MRIYHPLNMLTKVDLPMPSFEVELAKRNSAMENEEKIIMPPVAQIDAGFSHSIFLTREGEVWVCGRGNTGTLGYCKNGVKILEDQFIPVHVELPEKIVQISCGQNHNVALSESGVVYTWGSSKFGQCGRPPAELVKMLVINPAAPGKSEFEIEFMHPGPIFVPSSMKVKRIKAGFYQTAIFTENDDVYVFGPSTYLPTRQTLDDINRKILDIDFGWKHTLLIAE